MSNSSIWPIDKTLSGATTPGQSGPGTNGNEGVPFNHQSSKTGVTSSDYLVSYPGHSGGGLLLCRDAVSVFYSPPQQGRKDKRVQWIQVMNEREKQCYKYLSWKETENEWNERKLQQGMSTCHLIWMGTA